MMRDITLYFLIWSLLSFFIYWPIFTDRLTKGHARPIISLRFLGAVLFGGIPILVTLLFGQSLAGTLGLQMPQIDSSLYFWGLALLLILPMSFFQSKSKQNLKDYPQIREKEWTNSLLVRNAISWMTYLIGYEILFRGALLFPLIDAVGFNYALVINTILYSLTHMSKGYREALGTLPIGIILFLIAWKTESILFPLLIHWTMALSNSFFSLKHHPEMKRI